MNARNYQGSIMRKMGVAFCCAQVATCNYQHVLINLLGASIPISNAATILTLDEEGFRTPRYLLGILSISFLSGPCSFCPGAHVALDG